MVITPQSFQYVIIVAIICRTTAASTTPSSIQACRIISNTSLDCSNLGLTEIPNDIPNTTLILNLSFNQISQLDENALNAQQLEEVDLSHNKLINIHRGAFGKSLNLTKINLRENEISLIDAFTFADLMRLESLDISFNPIRLQDSFMIQSKLKELSMDHCSLDEIPNEAFLNVSKLESLSLKGNPFNNFDATPFEHFSSLTKLRMHNLSREAIEDLCKVIESIDTINFDGFNLSCFILADTDDFDQAIIGNDLPIQMPVLHETTKKPSTTSTTSTTTTPVPLILTTKSISAKNVTVTTEAIDTTTKEEVKEGVVNVDKETIQYMLIGILAVTLMGIAIGLICRVDVCGIKTKMCRNSKNRRKPEDSVSPFEEIPLNTVSVNGNGKTQTNNDEG